MKKDVVLMIYPAVASAATVNIFLNNDKLNIVGILVSNRFNKNSNVFKDAMRIWKESGLKFLHYCVMCADLPWGGMGLESRFKRQTKHIPVLWTKDVNSKESKAWLRERNCDYIASCYFNQIIDMEVVSIPKIDCVNAHAALLPNRRGPLPIFWTMHQGLEKAAVSIHKVEEELDMGEVYFQKEITMTGKSLLWNEFYCWSFAAKTLSDWIAHPETYEFNRFSQREDEGSYQPFPTKNDVKEFLNRGNKLFRKEDLREALAFIKSSNFGYLETIGEGNG